MRRNFTRLSALALFLAACPVLVAQDATTGAIVGQVKSKEGQPIKNARVLIDGGRGQQTYTTDDAGTFRVSSLIPGKYTVTVLAEGYERMTNQIVSVTLNQRTPMNVVLGKAAQATVEVVASISKLDTTTVTSGTQFSTESFSALPLGRSFLAVAQMAPGVVGSGVDNQNPSIGGGSGLENQYVIDGANTTNPGYGSSGSYSSTYGSMGSGINGDFIQEVQVKSFALDAEFGQTTGGIVNAITKSGSNTFEGSAFAYFDLDSMQARDKVPDLIDTPQAKFDSNNRTELGFTFSGPLVKDKLFFFVGFNPIQNVTKRSAPIGDWAVSGRQFEQKQVTNSYYVKLQWSIANNQLLEFSTFGDPGERKLGPQAQADFRGTEAKFSTLKFGSNTFTLKYNATFFDNLLLEGRLSQVGNTFKREISAMGDSEWVVADTGQGGLQLSQNAAGLYEKELKGGNQQFDLKASWAFTNFDIKAGFLMEKVTFDSTNQRSGRIGFSDPHAAGTVFTTGLSIQKRYYVDKATDPASAAKPYYRIVRGLTNPPTRKTETDYQSYFIQGNYRLGNFNIKAGIRAEEQKIKGTDIEYKFKSSDNMSPRLSVTWDFEGNGKSKLYAFWGRYFEKVPLDIAVRALSTEQGVNRSDFKTLVGFSDLQDPIMDGTAIYDVNKAAGTVGQTPVTTHFARTGSHPTEILAGTKAMYQDEMVLGLDFETAGGATFSNRFIYRNVGRVLEDLSLDGDSYFIGNPGENEGEIRKLTGYEDPATFPAPTRKYYAFEFEARKQMEKWQAFLNFRIAKLEGNYEGLFRGDNGQDDPNISSLFDLPVEMMTDSERGLTGREQYLTGALPTDRTVVANIGANYQFDFGLNLGLLARVQTGTPITTYLAHPVYENAGEIPLYGRGTEGRLPTSYNFDLSAQYAWNIVGKHRVTFRADIFNLFNKQFVNSIDTNFDVGLGADNPNYMRVNGYDTGRRVRLGLKYNF